MIVIRVPDPFMADGVRIELDGRDVTDCWVSVRLLADGRALLDLCARDGNGRPKHGLLGPQVIGAYSIETIPGGK